MKLIFTLATIISVIGFATNTQARSHVHIHHRLDSVPPVSIDRLPGPAEMVASTPAIPYLMVWPEVKPPQFEERYYEWQDYNPVDATAHSDLDWSYENRPEVWWFVGWSFAFLAYVGWLCYLGRDGSCLTQEGNYSIMRHNSK